MLVSILEAHTVCMLYSYIIKSDFNPVFASSPLITYSSSISSFLTQELIAKWWHFHSPFILISTSQMFRFRNDAVEALPNHKLTFKWHFMTFTLPTMHFRIHPSTKRKSFFLVENKNQVIALFALRSIKLIRKYDRIAIKLLAHMNSV